MMNAFVRSRRGAITMVVFLALILRLYAAFNLPIDYDEPTYLETAFDYARFIRQGNIQAIIDYPEVREHPPLVRLIYGSAILPLGIRGGFSDALTISRLISVIFGTLAVWLVALIDPLAGGLLAIQTYAVKYTSQAYLEALPLFAALAALITLRLSKIRRDRWFWLSAAALGLAAAGKYSYLPILFVILYVFLVDKKYTWRDLLVYGLTAAGLFLLANPALWHDPVNRLWGSIAFHAQYSQSAHVEASEYTHWYQPLLWLSQSYPYIWHPDVFFYNPLPGLLSVDGMIFVLALVGVPLIWRKDRYVAVWLATGVLALLFWPTKWPQYTLVVIPAFCFAAAATLRRIRQWILSMEDYYGWFSMMIPLPSKAFWIILAVVVTFFTGFTLVSGINIALERRGWSHYIKDTSSLPGNTVNALEAGQNGQMLIGSDLGLAIWTPAAKNEVEDHWQVFTNENSPLPSDKVTSLHQDRKGVVWVGTRSGLARFDGGSWMIFQPGEKGFMGKEVFDIEEDSEGRIWVGTDQGASQWDGKQWTGYTPANSALQDSLVLSLAIDRGAAGDLVYFGTGGGLARLDTATGMWENLGPGRFGGSKGGVSDLLVDSQGKLWAATLGSGLHVLDQDRWLQYTMSNSDLPSNRVDKITEIGQGIFWIAASFPERPGGMLARFDGKDWKIFQAIYSGYSGASTVAIAQDAFGRIWFGSLAGGLDIYRPFKLK